MATFIGTVLFAQEGRLHVVDDAGAGRLFILAPSAALETQQLHRLQSDQARVRVRYSEAPNLIASRAERVERLAPEAPA
jgi:hypothetical protein